MREENDDNSGEERTGFSLIIDGRVIMTVAHDASRDEVNRQIHEALQGHHTDKRIARSSETNE